MSFPQSLQPPIEVPQLPPKVRVHSPVGTALAVWHGDPEEVDGRHHVEWSVNEDLLWGHNTQLAALAGPGLWQEHEQLVLRGRLALAEDGTASLEVGDAQILFDFSAPPPEGTDGAWVEIRIEAGRVALWPFRI
ncbi:hypothetical protein [Streptomyces violascens]|uniref:Uncharacterized protein n=1 Tax=Streptomyces violascens TaxID=67381 RepID=A0ABQ3QSC3_9ACTN|nr:hypothetical protein [Streptomyces violascens]GGU50589.1 hypothetical protein GCM10010289_83790 [Streptomyces violascens]GHI40186.1 hypothetical protein Sviol_45940 [Streptomyces violascens]